MDYLTPEDYATAEANGICRHTVYQRFYHYGWDKQRAITEKIRTKESDIWKQYKDICAKHGLSSENFQGRLKLGWDPMIAATTHKLAPGQTRERTERSTWVAVAVANGIKRETFYKRVERGWTEEEAATTPLGSRKFKPREIGKIVVPRREWA